MVSVNDNVSALLAIEAYQEQLDEEEPASQEESIPPEVAPILDRQQQQQQQRQLGVADTFITDRCERRRQESTAVPFRKWRNLLLTLGQVLVAASLLWMFLLDHTPTSNVGTPATTTSSSTTIKDSITHSRERQEECPSSDWEGFYQNATESPPEHDCDGSLLNGFFGREPKICSCHNPLLPWNRNKYDEQHAERVERGQEWHQQLLDQAQRRERPVDIVFYGSSIMEQWMGAYYGRVTNKQNAQAFADQFGPDQSLHGLVMGMSGETTASLLHHIQSGDELPDWLNPKIIWITIGTNDMAHHMCSEYSITLAVMHLVRTIKQLRPQVKIVLNSILPVGRDDSNFSLWDDPANKVIRQVNHRRECFVASAKDVYFFNATQIFLDQNNHNKVNATRFREDFLHPSLEGYQAWGQAMSDFAQMILSTDRQ